MDVAGWVKMAKGEMQKIRTPAASLPQVRLSDDSPVAYGSRGRSGIAE